LRKQIAKGVEDEADSKRSLRSRAKGTVDEAAAPKEP